MSRKGFIPWLFSVVVLFSSCENTYGIETVFVSEETTISCEGGGLLLLPSELDGNNGSLSLLFSCFGYDMLVSGDLEEAGEALLLHDYPLPEVELYVAGHHGSAHASSAALLSKIRPETVLISVGENRYGHPAPAVVSKLGYVLGDTARLFRTDIDGSVRFELWPELGVVAGGD